MVAVLRNAQKKTWRRREKDGEVKKDDVIICLRGHEVGCDSTMFAMFLAVSVSRLQHDDTNHKHSTPLLHRQQCGRPKPLGC